MKPMNPNALSPRDTFDMGVLAFARGVPVENAPARHADVWREGWVAGKKASTILRLSRQKATGVGMPDGRRLRRVFG